MEPRPLSHAAAHVVPGAAPATGGRMRLGGPAFAAIDLGTNNCRLLVATPSQDGFRVVDSFSRIVRLGEGLYASGQLGAAAMDRAITALQDCATRLARRPVRRLRAIATEACRQAGNGRDFLMRVRHETGLSIDVISPREEAELAVEGCASLLTGPHRRALLFDIGGGSTELAWVQLRETGRPDLIGSASLPIGVVTLAERFGASGFAPEGFRIIVEEVTAALASFEATHRIGQEIHAGGVRLLGTSGTVTTLAGIALRLPRYSRAAVDGTVLTREAADRALAMLCDLGRRDGRSGIARHPCVGAQRADFVLPGCAVYAAIARLWPVSHLVVADRGLREGMLLRMIRADRRRASGHGAGRRRP